MSVWRTARTRLATGLMTVTVVSTATASDAPAPRRKDTCEHSYLGGGEC